MTTLQEFVEQKIAQGELVACGIDNATLIRRVHERYLKDMQELAESFKCDHIYQVPPELRPFVRCLP